MSSIAQYPKTVLIIASMLNTFLCRMSIVKLCTVISSPSHGKAEGRSLEPRSWDQPEQYSETLSPTNK